MSYDITIGDHWSNYTYNIARMLYEDGFSWNDWHGKEGLAVGTRLDLLIERMEREPERFIKHDPPNGWGDYRGCLNWLKGIRRACVDHPYDLVRVS